MMKTVIVATLTLFENRHTLLHIITNNGNDVQCEKMNGLLLQFTLSCNFSLSLEVFSPLVCVYQCVSCCLTKGMDANENRK